MKRLGLISGKGGTLHAALVEDSPSAKGFGPQAGAPMQFRIFRKGDRTGAVYLARVAKLEQGSNATFLDLGDGRAFLPFRKARKLNPKARSISEAVCEGDFIVVRLEDEAAEAEKLPAAEVLGEPSLGGKPGLLREAPPPLERALSFLTGAEEILVEGRTLWLAAKKATGKCKLYGDRLPLMEAFGVSAALDEARAGVTALPGGGSVTIEETRAMTVIDVNGGGLAPLDADLAAAPVIARALRFQNIGGLIAIDFIDLASRRDRAKLVERFAAALARDPARPAYAGPDRFGVMTVRRKRSGPSLKRLLE